MQKVSFNALKLKLAWYMICVFANPFSAAVRISATMSILSLRSENSSALAQSTSTVEEKSHSEKNGLLKRGINSVISLSVHQSKEDL